MRKFVENQILVNKWRDESPVKSLRRAEDYYITSFRVILFAYYLSFKYSQMIGLFDF